MAIDRADWHSGSNHFPSDLPERAGGTHIGFFLYWLITREYIGRIHKKDDFSIANMLKVRSGEMTGCEFLFGNCDGKFWDTDVTDSMLPFVHWYYGQSLYYSDLTSIWGDDYPTLYHTEDSQENAVRIAAIIDSRFREWHER